jgi:hypothetical protein
LTYLDVAIEEIRQIADGIDRSTLIGVREAPIILLDYAWPRHRAELVTPDKRHGTLFDRRPPTQLPAPALS